LTIDPAIWRINAGNRTAQTYLHAHLELKEAALAKLNQHERAKQFRPNDRLLVFLNAHWSSNYAE
jgi:integrase/recombinase XerD